MVEIEIGVMVSPVPRSPHPRHEEAEAEVTAWARTRNASGAKVRWMFGIEKAREKLGRAYPQPAAVTAACAA